LNQGAESLVTQHQNRITWMLLQHSRPFFNLLRIPWIGSTCTLRHRHARLYRFSAFSSHKCRSLDSICPDWPKQFGHSLHKSDISSQAPFHIINCERHFHSLKSLAVIKLRNGIGSPEPDRIDGVDKSSMPDRSTESRRQKIEGMIKALVVGM